VIRILIVDDVHAFAESAATLVSARTGIATDFVTDPDEALAEIEREPVAVVVLDQKMPKMPGTELFQRIKLIRPDIRAIMLTGEASADEVGTAIQTGYHDYLAKSRIEELPEKVVLQYTQQLAAAALDRPESPTVVWPRRWWRRLFRTTQIKLLTAVELNHRHIDQDAWRTIIQLNAGEQRKVTYQSSHTVEVTISQESKRALKATLNLQTKVLDSAVTSILEDSETITRTRTDKANASRSHSQEQTLSLPEPADPHAPTTVRARHFQQAPIYRKLLVTLQVRCSGCRTRTPVPLLIYIGTDQVATRHKDHLNDGTTRTLDTGFLPLSAD
jgi:CheY-like chemotaxis protein